MKQFFQLDKPYQFEWNNLRCVLTCLNVWLVLAYGASLAWMGVSVALLGIIKDLTKDRRISGLIMHSATLLLNIFFLIRY